MEYIHVKADEIKRHVSIEQVVQHYGGSLNAKGEGRCLRAEHHHHGDADPSMKAHNGYVKCWSQGCFGDKGVDIFALVGVMENLPAFKDQRRRVLEIAGLNWTQDAPRTILRTYRWVDEAGREAYKLRWNREKPGDKCTWAQDPENRQSGLGPCRPTLRDLDGVEAASAIILCEGESDQETVKGFLKELGLLGEWFATTTPHGANDVKLEYLTGLHGKARVFLSGDNDASGQGYLEKCGQVLKGQIGQLLTLRVPDGLKDWRAWAEAGGTAEQFRVLLDTATAWTPPQQPANEMSANDRSHLPEMDASIGDLHELTTRSWALLQAANTPEHLFRYGRQLVRFEYDQDRNPFLAELTPERLRNELVLRARWTRLTKQDGRVATRPPMDLVKNMLVTENPPLPGLRQIAEVPVFSPEGLLLSAPGYHGVGRIYLAPYDPSLRTVFPAHPMPEELTKAKAILDELLTDFPFKSEADKAHAVGLFVLPMARPLIPGPTPLHVIEAPEAGSGKGLLAQVLLLPFVGDRIGMITAPKDPDEWRKRITTRFREGRPVTVIDNLSRPLDSGDLSSALTQWPLWEDRVLGKNEGIAAPATMLWVLTANNPTISLEIARRCIRIRLDAHMDRPWLRTTFTHPDLRDWTLTHRAELLWVAAVFIQAWLNDGRKAPKVLPLGSFESWTRVVGGIVEQAGYSGFLGNALEFYETADSEGTAWRMFTSEWWAHHGPTAVGVKDLFLIAKEIDGLYLGKSDKDRSQQTSLGLQLRKYRDRVVGDYRIEAGGDSGHNANLWRLQALTVPAAAASSASSSQAEPATAGQDLYGEEVDFRAG